MIKDRSDTELRNLKQELSKQRYMVEELSSKENMVRVTKIYLYWNQLNKGFSIWLVFVQLSKQVLEWQKKYHSLKEAYKGDTDAWQKELTDFEQVEIQSFDRLIGWLIKWLVVWSIYWWIDWLIEGLFSD